MDKDPNPIIVGIIIASMLASVIGAMCGLIDTCDARNDGKTGCKYTSIMSFNPGRVLVCELGRKRFEFP